MAARSASSQRMLPPPPSVPAIRAFKEDRLPIALWTFLPLPLKSTGHFFVTGWKVGGSANFLSFFFRFAGLVVVVITRLRASLHWLEQVIWLETKPKASSTAARM